MNYTLKNANIIGIPRPNVKGEYPKFQGRIVLESTDGKGARIVKDADYQFTDAEKAVIDGIWAKLEAKAQGYLKEANS